MVIALSLGAALFIGIGDVFGSLAGRRGRVLAATLWVILTSAVPIAVIAVVYGGEARPADYWLGAIAGVSGGLGLLTLYAGYARTTVGIVGPITAVVSAVLPVTVGIAIGDPAGSLTLIGIVVGVAAIALIGWKPDTRGLGSRRTAIAFGVGAGLAFGVMATVLGLTREQSNLLPLIPVRVVSALALGVIGGAARRPLWPSPGSWKYIPWAVVGSAGGMMMFTLAAQENLTIAGLLLQMAYGVSALLAIFLFQERPTRTQLLGFAGAIASIVLISVG